MRKIAISLIIILLPLFVLSQQQHQQYNYPVKRGSPAWDTLKTYAEKRAVSQIPAHIVRQLTTRALLESVLDYPLLGDLFVFDSLQMGVDKLKQNFHAFHELLARKDVAAVTIARYRQFKIDSARSLASLYAKGEYSFKMSFLEALLAQPEITGSLKRNEKIALLQYLVNNYERKEKLKDIYGGLSLGTIAWPVYHLNRQLDPDKAPAGTDSTLYKGIMVNLAPWNKVMTEARRNFY